MVNIGRRTLVNRRRRLTGYRRARSRSLSIARRISKKTLLMAWTSLRAKPGAFGRPVNYATRIRAL